MQKTQKKSLLLALALAVSASSWAQNVTINGTGVSLEANKTPIHTAKNPQAIAQLPGGRQPRAGAECGTHLVGGLAARRCFRQI